MIEKISFQYPWWFIFGCLLLGVFYAWLLYRKESRFAEGPRWLKSLLALLRFLAVSLIAFLLVGPIVKSMSEDQQDPIVVLLEDRSKSISTNTPKDKLAAYEQSLDNFKKKISEKYNIKTLYFGDEVAIDKINGYTFNTTNISSAIRYIDENFADQNLGSIVLCSDGIYNEGSNPAYDNNTFKAPLYTVALGDTTVRKDLVLKNVLHNKIAYLGDKFSVQIDLAAYNCQGNASKIKVEKVKESGRKTLYDAPVNIDNNNYFKTIELPLDADETGIIRYSISAAPVGNEISTQNNRRDIFVEVLDGRQKILIYANAPHPDIAALNTIITSNKNYAVTTAFAYGAKPSLSEYNLVIFHNLPSDQNDAAAEITQVKSKSIPSMFIAGTQINTAKFNQAQDVIKINGNSKTNEDAETSFNGAFNQFTLTNELKNQLSKFPPLTSVFGSYEALPSSNVLLYQKIKKIATKYPLIAFNDKSGVKSCVISGEGIWKWKLADFVDNSNAQNLTELINKSIQLVTVKDDKRKFRVNLAKNLFKEDENIVFDAQLYNDAYEMINESDVNLVIKDEARKEFKYTFSKTANYYTLDAGIFPEGTYQYTATTAYRGVPLSVNGKFSVQAVQLEQFDLTAKHDVLRTLAKRYNGSMFAPNNLNALADLILKNDKIKPVIFQSSQSKTLLHYKWIFFIILALISLEWFLRRYYGSY